MTEKRPDPVRPANDEARKLAKDLLGGARFGALAVRDPQTGAPYVARVGVVGHEGAPLILISTLSTHTRALTADPACSILLGEPGDKGDPLTHPRMTVMGTAEAADKAALKDVWLTAIPKAALYYDFADFELKRIRPSQIHLNGGFGKAFLLLPDDLV